MAVHVAGTTVTFTPPAGATALVGDFTDWKKKPPLPVVGGAPLVLSLPRDSWTEYAWLGADGKPFADPDNAQRSLNPWWPYPRAVQVGTFPQHPIWSAPEPEARGTITRVTWEGGVFPGTRRAVVYTPPGYVPGVPLPVYYVQDGVAFYRTGKLAELMDRALHAGAVTPCAFAFVEPGDRSEEYYLNDRYLDFLTAEVFPRVEGELVVAGERGLWGASLGGLISLHLGSAHPELFARVVSHSGAFIASRAAAARGEVDTTTAGEELLERLRREPPTHLRLSLDTGTLEWLLAPNRRMAALVADLGLPHQYREYASGHNWVTWRAALTEALLYMQGV
ncbi:alpha/beta hydrolase [Deinococcus maricopensis]|uniref:Esterase n=1 Tax=Deinococcus maricopensis (strain DSM 21211 / LMG 22137 / NRRL B-23946 / LB-34) TaxID=709986 RepID=E8U5P8_DEIML|nr:alpha/beta hydrolase-fold protein [Deinococcus maricopensis]ADV66387.1 esterase [Deinococcus maricopensis DSM 21211]